MKKSILIVAMVLCCTFIAKAQPRAIGINLGPWTSFSYEHGFGSNNMLDVAANAILPLFNNRFGVGGHVTYDWIDPFGATFPWNEKGEWHWYMGVGGSAGYVWDNDKTKTNWFYAGAAGHIGFEYDFWFPLQLSVDWRPSVGINNMDNKIGFNQEGIWGPISIGVRYLFH